MKSTRVVVVGILLAGSLVHAHVDLPTVGIRFNEKALDFGQPAPQFTLYHRTRAGTRFLEPDLALTNYSSTAYRRPLFEGLMEKVGKAEERHDWKAAMPLYRKLAELRFDFEHEAAMRIELLKGASAFEGQKEVQQLIESTSLVAESGATPKETALPPTLRPYALYKLASEAYESGDYLSASGLYGTVAERYPRFAFSGAARLMSARCLLTDVNPAPDHRDFERGNKQLQKLLREDPNGRYAADAYGLMARSYYLRSRLGEAATLYWRMAGYARTPRQRDRAFESLALCYEALGLHAKEAIAWIRSFDSTDGDRHYRASQAKKALRKLDARSAHEFSQLLRQDPAALHGYIVLRLEIWTALPVQRQNLISLIEAALPSAEGTLYQAALQSRAAELSFALRDPTGTVRHATDATRSPRARPDDAARGMYLLASVKQRQGNTRQAIRQLEQLTRRWPSSYLATSAKEALALLYDRSGSYASALDALYSIKPEYIPDDIVEHRADIAYLVDVKMSTAQLAAYVRSRPQHIDRKALLYTLALRHMSRRQLGPGAKNLLRPFQKGAPKVSWLGTAWSQQLLLRRASRSTERPERAGAARSGSATC